MINYAVITRGRAETIHKKTLKALEESGVMPDDVTIFAHPDEAAEYRVRNPKWKVIEGGDTLENQRTAVARHFPEGARVVSCDDDVRFWATTEGRLASMPLLAETMFQTAEKVGAKMWGVYPVNNEFFMKASITFGLHFLIGQTFGFVSRGPEAFPVEASPKDDWWLTLQSFTEDGVVLRVNSVACASEMRGKGGIEHLTDDRRAMNEAATRKKLARFGHLVEEKPSEVGKDREIKVIASINKPFKSMAMDAYALTKAVAFRGR